MRGQFFSRRHSTGFAAALVVIALAVAGCGSSSSSNFKKDYTKTDTQLRQLGVDLASALRTAKGSTDVALATKFDSFATRSRKIADDLGKLKPPDKVKSDVTQLRGALTTIAGDMTAIAKTARAHDAKAARTATQTLVRDAAPVRAASTAIRNKEGIKRTGG
jgi:hypothetical protein